MRNLHKLSVEPWKTLLSNNKNGSTLKEKFISKNSSILMEKFTYCDKNTDKLLKLDNACLIEHRNEPEFKELDTWILNSTELEDYRKAYSELEIIMIERPDDITNRPGRYHTVMHILAKKHENVSGIAYGCQFNKVSVTLTTSFTGRQFPPIFSRKTKSYAGI